MLLVAFTLSGCLSQFDLFDEDITLSSVKEKIESGTDVNDQDALGRTLLYVAVQEEKPDIVEYLISKGADVNIVDKQGLSPLMVAAQKANFEIIKLLIENGADINYQKEDNSYALYELIGNENIHADKDYVAMAKYFVEHGADYRLTGYNNYTLIDAARSVKMVRYLESLGMSIYDVTENNATSLFGSVANKGEGTEVTQYYINHCVDLFKVATFDDVSMNALEMAQKMGRFESAELIAKAMKHPPKECVDSNETNETNENIAIAPLIKFYNSDANNTTDVTLEISNQGNGIGNYEIYLNGIDLNESDRVELLKDETTLKILKITLENGLNEIKVYAYDGANKIRSNALYHTVIGVKKVQKRPNLYAVVIGIDNFLAKEVSLEYAVADATLVGTTIFKRSRKLFDKVNIIYLKKENTTTKESILKALKSLEGISQNDLFIFYAATLGTTIDDKYYMLTSDIYSIDNEYLRANALSEDELRNGFKNIPAKNKLLLFDTTYAGGIAKSISKKLFDNSDEKLNITSISATSKTQITLEGYANGYSTFAYVLSDALEGEADINKDTFVDSNELAKYTQKVVEVETKKYNHIQTPVIYSGGDIFNLSKLLVYKDEVVIKVQEECPQESLDVVDTMDENTTLKEEKKTYAEQKFEISNIEFDVQDNAIFIQTQDELKNHFNFINAQGETLVVFDFYSDTYVPYGEKEIESKRVTKIEVGYHTEFYRVVLHTKIREDYEYIISDNGIEILLKDER